MPTREPTDKCHVFVSRRTVDRKVFGEEILGELMTLAAARLTFFDARGIPPAANWKETIGENLEEASLFFLLLTGPPDANFNWLLYEAGWFKGLSLTEGQHGMIVCLVPKGRKVPDQLDDLQAVMATRESVTNLLLKLYHDQEFTNTTTPLNRAVTPSFLEGLADRICKAINDASTTD